MAATLIAFTMALAIGLTAAYRGYVVLSPKRRKQTLRPRQRQKNSTHLLIVLGSGGHTAEMIAMLERAADSQDPARRMDWRDYTHRTWIISSGDSISAKRANEFEKLAIELSMYNNDADGGEQPTAGTSLIVTVPRARQIHQSIFTAPFSCLRCMISCFLVLLQQAESSRGFPDLVLCNGPATATILVFAAIILRLLDLFGCEKKGKLRMIYIESWARVKKLSLSGKLLLRLVDRFLVQWPQLEELTGGKAEYLGVLV